MRFLAVFPAALMIAGCVQGLAPQPEPQAARLTTTELIVVLSDGNSCRAAIDAAGGAGRLSPCGPGFDYRVDLVSNPNVLRQFAQAAFGVLGAEGHLAPMGRVTLTDASGKQYDFVSPLPIPE